MNIENPEKVKNKQLTSISPTKPDAIIHEASHIILGTKDHAYGFQTEKNNSLSKEQAKMNADSYRLAAESVGLGAKVTKLLSCQSKLKRP